MINQYKEQYDARKKAVLAYLDNSIQQLRAWEQERAAAPLEKLRNNVEEGLFSIVLVGEFSAGKSTFLNALMHKRILPSFTGETTATVNFLRHRDQAPDGVLGRVYYRNGTVEDLHDLERSTIESVVSTNGDKDDQTVAGTIDHVDLFLDSAFLQDGVMLVDSPGLNGMRGNHREITEQQIKASHACIFMFRANQPGSRTEFESLRQLKSHSNNIFFVINRIDEIRSSENETVEGVIQNLRETYHKQFPEESELPKIWPVASLAALVARDSDETAYLGNEVVTTQERRDELEQFSRLGAFEERLWKYLTQGERARDQLYGPVSAAMTALIAERDRFDTQIKLLQEKASGEDLKKQRELLESDLEKLKKSRQNIPSDLSGKVRNVVRNLKENAGQQAVEIKRRIEMRLNDCELPTELLEAKEGLSSELDRKFSHMARKLDETLKDELLAVVSEEYAEYIQDLEDRFAESSEQGSFQFTSKEIVISDASIGINLEKFEAECNALRAQIEEMEAIQEQSQLSAIQARKTERMIREKKEELKDLRQSREFIRDNFMIPEVNYHTEEVDDSYWRSGLFGWIGNALFGKKKATRTITVPDTSAQDSAQTQREQKISDLNADINRLQQEIQNAPEQKTSSEEQEAINRQAQEKLRKLEAELKQLQEEHKEELRTQSAKACKRMRRKIMDDVDGITEEVTSQIRSYINGQERQYICAVRDILNMSLEQEITAAQKKLDDLLNLIQTEGEERDRLLEEAGKAKEIAKALVEKGVSLCTMLEETMDDHVEQETL